MTAKTEIFDAADEDALRRASDLLLAGELVAFPTETVYGLGANGLDAGAVEKIFLAKGRPADNPLILHVPSIEQAMPLWRADQRQRDLARELARAFWPGPLSLVLTASADVPSLCTGGLDSVAVRAPAHPVAQRLLELSAVPLAAPSANLSGRPSPTRAEHVAATLADRIAAIVDGGATNLGIESTVLDLRGELPRLLRPGTLGRSEIEAVVGRIELADDITSAASPGLRHRHYQPQGVQLQLLDTHDIEERWQDAVGVLCFEATASRLGDREAPLITLPDDVDSYGAALYDALYRLEIQSSDRFLVEKVPDSTEWKAIGDRLLRAVGR